MSICVNCYLENELLFENINGRCDNCGCTSFEDKEVLDEENLTDDQALKKFYEDNIILGEE